VRKRIKDGEDGSDDSSMPRQMPAQPVIRDPSLARGGGSDPGAGDIEALPRVISD